MMLDPTAITIITNLTKDLNEDDAKALEQATMNFIKDAPPGDTRNWLATAYTIGFAAGLIWRDEKRI